MKNAILFLFSICLTNIIVAQEDSSMTIAFGSCSNQDKPLPIFSVIAKHQPDLFIYLGDNIYADTYSMCKMKRKYLKLSKNKDFRLFREKTPIIATWDDHDYGQNDIGRHYTKKEQSKKIFLRFFKEPENSERRKHAGIYTSYLYPFAGKTIQIILLDNRTFRDDLLPYDGSLNGDSTHSYDMDYSPYTKADSTLLGAEQWRWLEGELLKKADLRIIGSSTQFATEYNGYETWANFPHEQKRMLQLIQSTQANGVFFISGDVHYSELSLLENAYTYPIYDLTASGLTEKWGFAAPNKFRVGQPVIQNHFAVITINLKLKDPEIKLQVWDISDSLRIEQIVHLSEMLLR
jgi:alkaline phosphatase D